MCKNFTNKFLGYCALLSLFVFNNLFFACGNVLSENKPKDNVNITLKVGTNTPFPPFGMVENGEVVGIDIDIVKEISKETGIKFDILDIPFETIIGGLQAHKIDIGVSGIGITEERKKSVDFSDIYFKADFAFLTKKNDDIRKKNRKLVDMFAGKKIGVQSGTTMEGFLLDYNKTASETEKVIVVSISDNATLIECLINNKIDGLLTEGMQGKVYSKQYSNIDIEMVKTTTGGYAIAFPKGSKYRKIINDALIKIKKEGRIDKIIKKWEDEYINKINKAEKEKYYFNSLLFIVKGSLITLQYSICAIVFGLIIATIMILFIYSKNKILYFVARTYISVTRGTPLLLQMSIVYFCVSNAIGVNLSVFTACVIALSINSAGYVAEIIRSGVRSIDKGQFDACKSLNLSKYQAIKDVYAPQVIHNILPAMINEFIALIKESSIVSVLGGYEIMKRANIVIAEQYTYFVPLIVAGLTYYAMTSLLELFSHFCEKRYKY